MGRQTRQQRRQQARRDALRQTKSPTKRVSWQFMLAAVVIIGALGLFAHQVFGSTSGGSSGSNASSLLSDNPPVDGIKCGATEVTSYHEHAHLTIDIAGKTASVPAQLGISSACLYWVHTHDASGIIHMEAPVGVGPSLKTVVDIWREPGQTVSRTQIFDHRVPAGKRMKVWVNLRPYAGNPATIRLHRHTNITIEIGPPFVPPKKYDFGQL